MIKAFLRKKRNNNRMMIKKYLHAKLKRNVVSKISLIRGIVVIHKS